MTASQTVKKSWKRAHALNKLADGPTTPAKARSFLSNNKEYAELLDGKTDKRNPKIREILDAYHKYLTEGGGTQKTRRKSKGDPNKEVRAGAPQPRQPRKTGGKPRTSGKIKDGEAYQILQKLRNIQRDHPRVTTTDLCYYADLLGRLVDEPVNVKEVLQKTKETTKAFT